MTRLRLLSFSNTTDSPAASRCRTTSTTLRWPPACVLAALFLPLLCAEPLSQFDRDFAMSHLHSTRKMFLDSIDGLSEAQWNFKAGPDRWSIAECAEHITVSEQLLFQLAMAEVKKPPTGDASRREEVKGKEKMILASITERNEKFTAPAVIAPKHAFENRAALTARFKELRDRSIAYLQTTPDDLHDHYMTHPVAGAMDLWQWFLMCSAHTERHTQQILEVKTAPGYPKS